MKNYLESNAEVIQRDESGFFKLEKDKEAVVQFLQEAEQKTKVFASSEERILWLVNNDYYYRELLEEYTMEQILEVERIAYSLPHVWESFMSVSKFYSGYALKTNDKSEYLEDLYTHNAIVALNLANGDFNKAKKYVSAMMRGYQPATPTYQNAGRARRGELVSCFLLETDDSLNSMNFVESTSSQLSKGGGGVSINGSNIRSAGEDIKGIKGAASGIVPFMKVLDDKFIHINQLGQRDGAGAFYYNVFGKDSTAFLDTKKISADDLTRIHKLSLGLIIPDKFVELVFNDEDLYFFGAHSIFKEYGLKFEDVDFDSMYTELIQNPNIDKVKSPLNARAFLNKIMVTLIESGYPYMFFEGNANRLHPLRKIGRVKFTNLCTEIMQLSELSVITDYGQEDEINRDISCNLGSVNIRTAMKNKNPKELIFAGMDMLTSVSDMSDIQNAPTVNKANRELHSVGLGYMNLHGYLAENKVMYGSPESIEFVHAWGAMFDYYTLLRSCQIAMEKNETFLGCEHSDYADGSYFDKYMENDYNPTSPKIKALFEGIALPGKEEWEEAKRLVMKYGLYHAYRQAIAPTQSIGYVQNSTQSIMPAVAAVETRTYRDSKTYFPMPGLSPQNMFFYKSAYDFDQKKIVDVVAAAQVHVDQGISCTIFVNDDISTERLAHIYMYAHYRELKSIYYIRTRNTQEEGCISCAM